MSTKETATTPATPMNSKAPSNAVSSAKSGGIGHSSDAEESELPGYQWDESIFVSLLAADFSQEDFQKLERNLNDIALLNRMVEVFNKTKAQKAEISRLEEVRFMINPENHARAVDIFFPQGHPSRTIPAAIA